MVKGWIWSKYFLHMYENRAMKLLKLFLEEWKSIWRGVVKGVHLIWIHCILWKYLNETWKHRSSGKYLPSKHKSLSSNPSKRKMKIDKRKMTLIFLFMIIVKTAIVRTMKYSHKYNHTNQWSRGEDLKMHPYIYYQMIFCEIEKIIQWENDIFLKSDTEVSRDTYRN
jgi:hypothetical protein